MNKPVMRLDCINRIKAEKSTLLRVVLKPDGTVDVDPSGKMNGRGVYLTPDEQTLAKAKASKGLDKVLGVKIPDEVYEKIGRYLK